MSSSSECEDTPMNDLHRRDNLIVNDFENSGASDSKTLMWSTFSLRTRNYTRWSPLEEGVTLSWRDLSIYVGSAITNRAKFKRTINSSKVYLTSDMNVTDIQVSCSYRSDKNWKPYSFNRGQQFSNLGKLSTNIDLQKYGAVVLNNGNAYLCYSGAGKSTLMSALAHRRSGPMIVEGDILINGRPIGDYMRQISGFMHQEDLFIGELTAWEHMKFMARLKLDRRITNHEVTARIEELLKSLGLTNCMHTRIGGSAGKNVLSGGERKRLSFAAELLNDPPLLFCDEPTTGLDSYSAQKIVTVMNSLASKGTTIMCTIHQPSSQIFAMFSQLILLGNGRIAFMGSTFNAIEFFNSLGYWCPRNYNPADFFIKTLATTPGFEEASKQAVKKICNHFVVSDYAKEIDVVVQYEFHMGRSCEVIALIVGLCYMGTITKTQIGIQAVEGALAIFVTENTFAAMYSVLAEFPLDRPLFNREYNSGLYSVGLYYISKVFALLPGLCIEATLFVFIAYWLVGLKASVEAFSITVLIIILTLNASTACGILFSIAFDSVPMAMSYLIPFDYILLITSGVFFNLSSLPIILSWTKYLSWLMYSTETLSILQWKEVDIIPCDTSIRNSPCLSNGKEVLDKYSFAEEHLIRDLCCLFLLCIIFHVMGFLCLWRKTRK